MGCYYTLCHNNYAYSLLFYKVYIKRENVGSWDSGLEKEQILETYSAHSKSPETSRKSFLEYIKNTERKKFRRGATPYPRGWGRALHPWARPLPRGPLVALRCPFSAIWSLSMRKEIVSKLSRRDSAATRRNLGGTNLGLRQSCSAGDTSLREGEIIAIANDTLIGRGSISINILTSTISSQTLVHLLYPIFVPKPQIGTCGLLVVLITPCS